MTLRMEPSEWDSTFWGVRAARIYVDHAPQLDDAIRLSDQEGVQWLSLLVPSAKRELIGAAIRRGFEIVDLRASLTTRVGERSLASDWSVAGERDTERLAEIARVAFSESRFFNDPFLPDERCREFYETWLLNCVSGEMADAVIVDRLAGEVTGFIAVRITDHAASLALVAVAPEHRGTGRGGRLLGKTLDWVAARGIELADVVTQVTNTRAVNLYTRAGFQLSGADVWLHRWSRPETTA